MNIIIIMQLEEIWLSSSDEEEIDHSGSDQSTAATSQPVWQLVYFLLMWQSLFRISNAALTVLFKFLKLFVSLFGHAFAHDAHNFEGQMPNTLQNAHGLLWKSKKDEFVTFVVCPKCDSVYEYDSCIITIGRRKEPKCCKHIAYPDHPHASRRQECGAHLLKKVRSGRTYKLSPIKSYPYLPLCQSFSYLVKRKGFLDACEKWRSRAFSIPDLYLGDIYDGRVWHEFESECRASTILLSANVKC